nr:MAG TPA: hypothetical protein [Caudoviricetes sp.]
MSPPTPRPLDKVYFFEKNKKTLSKRLTFSVYRDII